MEQIIEWTKNWIKSHSRPFWIGGSVSAFPVGYLLFSDVHIAVAEFVVRLAGVAMAGFVGGLCTSLGKDFREKRRAKLKKRKDAKAKKELEENKRKERAA